MKSTFIHLSREHFMPFNRQGSEFTELLFLCNADFHHKHCNLKGKITDKCPFRLLRTRTFTSCFIALSSIASYQFL